MRTLPFALAAVTTALALPVSASHAQAPTPGVAIDALRVCAAASRPQSAKPTLLELRTAAEDEAECLRQQQTLANLRGTFQGGEKTAEALPASTGVNATGVISPAAAAEAVAPPPAYRPPAYTEIGSVGNGPLTALLVWSTGQYLQVHHGMMLPDGATVSRLTADAVAVRYNGKDYPLMPNTPLQLLPGTAPDVAAQAAPPAATSSVPRYVPQTAASSQVQNRPIPFR